MPTARPSPASSPRPMRPRVGPSFRILQISFDPRLVSLSSDDDDVSFVCLLLGQHDIASLTSLSETITKYTSYTRSACNPHFDPFGLQKLARTAPVWTLWCGVSLFLLFLTLSSTLTLSALRTQLACGFAFVVRPVLLLRVRRTDGRTNVDVSLSVLSSLSLSLSLVRLPVVAEAEHRSSFEGERRARERGEEYLTGDEN